VAGWMIARGPKGDGLKKQIEAGKYPGIVKTRLMGPDTFICLYSRPPLLFLI
jgi:hypothetical protein